MKKLFTFILLLSFTTAFGQVHDTIIKYTFPDSAASVAPFPDTGLIANLNNKIMTVGVTGTIIYNHAGATTWSARATGWDSGNGTKYWLIKATTLNYTSLKLSSKQRSSGLGPKYFKAQYRAGYTGTWTDIAGANLTLANNFTNGNIANAVLPAACDNMDTVYIRWIMTSDSAVTPGSIVTVAGPSNIDDIWIVGNVISTGIDFSGVQHNITLKQTDDAIIVSLKEPAQRIAVYDLLGDLVYITSMNSTFAAINTEKFTKGIYFIKVFFGDQSAVVRKFLIDPDI